MSIQSTGSLSDSEKPSSEQPTRGHNSRSPEYVCGRREAVKWAVAWLHARASTMNDPQAASILNAAANFMGFEAKKAFWHDYEPAAHMNQIPSSDLKGE